MSSAIMPLLADTTTSISSATKHISWANSTAMGGIFTGISNSYRVFHLPANSPIDHKLCTRTYARRKSQKKLRTDGQSQNSSTALQSTDMSLAEEREGLSDKPPLEDNSVEAVQNTVSTPSRSDVLQACTVTSGLIAALGVFIRQVSHVASMEGLPILDCSTEISFGVEIWHLELITGLVMLISSCRYFLLRAWPDFAESTEAANRQVLTSVQPLDYVVVSFLPGVSEELLFRGALLPLFGLDWKSVLLVATIFGALHLGNGRKYSFAVWATFVGFMYGYATVVSSSIVVPMASHALNNLVGGLLWRKTSKSLE